MIVTKKEMSIYVRAIAKIEDVGLNIDFKKYGNKKGSQHFHDKPKTQNLIYCFSVLHRIKIKQYQFFARYLTPQEMLTAFLVILVCR